MKTTTNTCKNQKLSRKLREARVEAIETISVFLNFTSDPLDVFSKPMGTVKVWIMRKDFKRNQDYKKADFY